MHHVTAGKAKQVLFAKLNPFLKVNTRPLIAPIERLRWVICLVSAQARTLVPGRWSQSRLVAPSNLRAENESHVANLESQRLRTGVINDRDLVSCFPPRGIRGVPFFSHLRIPECFLPQRMQSQKAKCRPPFMGPRQERHRGTGRSPD